MWSGFASQTWQGKVSDRVENTRNFYPVWFHFSDNCTSLQGPVLSVAADPTGRQMVTTGADGQVKVWDLRTYQPLHSYFCPSPATWCDISQRGMLAVGWGRRINVWKDALTTKQRSPYMTHTLQAGQLRDFHFCPYEVPHLLLLLCCCLL